MENVGNIDPFEKKEVKKAKETKISLQMAKAFRGGLLVGLIIPVILNIIEGLTVGDQAKEVKVAIAVVLLGVTVCIYIKDRSKT